jgi:uncharacterized protein YcgI (DUF1989 family)
VRRLLALGRFDLEGPQVGDLNLWNAHDLTERFYSGKTRALHATHLSTGDRLWSTFPTLRPMAPNGICVSARVQEDATGKLDLAFEDLGE